MAPGAKITPAYFISPSSIGPIFVRMSQGLVEGLVDVSLSLTKLSSRLDFFFIVYLLGITNLHLI